MLCVPRPASDKAFSWGFSPARDAGWSFMEVYRLSFTPQVESLRRLRAWCRHHQHASSGRVGARFWSSWALLSNCQCHLATSLWDGMDLTAVLPFCTHAWDINFVQSLGGSARSGHADGPSSVLGNLHEIYILYKYQVTSHLLVCDCARELDHRDFMPQRQQCSDTAVTNLGHCGRP